MFDDSIVVDSDDGRRVPFVPYVGVAPGIYLKVFQTPRRKNSDGTVVDWEAIRSSELPRVASNDYGYLEAEDDSMATFLDLLQARLPGVSAKLGEANA